LAIREQLAMHGSLSLKELTRAVNAEGPNAQRVVSEVLRVLDQSQEITIDDDSKFRLANMTLWAEQDVKERTVEKKFAFLPRAQRLEPKIEGVSNLQIRKIALSEAIDWCTLPDEATIHSKDALSSNIAAASKTYYLNRPLRVYFEESDTRIELLQRSQLMFMNPWVVGANLLRAKSLQKWVVHRCYFYGTRSWKAAIYSFPRGPEQQGYTDYTNRLIRTDPAALECMLGASREL